MKKQDSTRVCLRCGRKGSAADITPLGSDTTNEGRCRNSASCNKARRSAKIQTFTLVDDCLTSDGADPGWATRVAPPPRPVLVVEPRIRPRFTREDEETALQLLREVLEVNPSLMEVRIFLNKFGEGHRQG